MTEKFLTSAAARRQRGAVLVVGLIILLILTMIGLTAMQGSSQQERMAGNLQEANIALQTVEAALRTAEAEVLPERRENTLGKNAFFINNPDGAPGVPFDPPKSMAVLKDKKTWKGNTGKQIASFAAKESNLTPATQPRYIVEKWREMPRTLEAGAPNALEVFRVTAAATGRQEEPFNVVQSTVIRVLDTIGGDEPEESP